MWLLLNYRRRSRPFWQARVMLDTSNAFVAITWRSAHFWWKNANKNKCLNNPSQLSVLSLKSISRLFSTKKRTELIYADVKRKSFTTRCCADIFARFPSFCDQRWRLRSTNAKKFATSWRNLLNRPERFVLFRNIARTDVLASFMCARKQAQRTKK